MQSVAECLQADRGGVCVPGVMSAVKLACKKRNVKKLIKNMAFRGTWRELASVVFGEVHEFSEKCRKFHDNLEAFCSIKSRLTADN